MYNFYSKIHKNRIKNAKNLNITFFALNDPFPYPSMEVIRDLKFITTYFHNENFILKPKFYRIWNIFGKFGAVNCLSHVIQVYLWQKIFGSYQISGGFRRLSSIHVTGGYVERNQMSQTIKFHWRAMPKIQFTSDLTFSPLISLKSESLVDYSSIESRIMAFRDKLIVENNFDRFLLKITISKKKNRKMAIFRKFHFWVENFDL